MNIKEQKAALRKKFIKARNQIDSEHYQILSKKVCKNFLTKVSLKTLKVVSIYYPINNEVNCIYLGEDLAEEGYKICLPKIVKKQKVLIFREYSPKDKLLLNSKFGVLEPKDNKKALIPDLVVVPLVSFDTNNYRLGYGGGFYDETINYYKTHNPNLKTVGLAFSGQRYENLPIENHDTKLDMIINEIT